MTEEPRATMRIRLLLDALEQVEVVATHESIPMFTNPPKMQSISGFYPPNMRKNP
jgi:hypothetical protein